ncbi:MAG: type IV pilus assembly protein PilM [Patescibacteria group bacterium]|nr:type IV pilus assembly protein PilM [Patescibacteria group bacterium]MDZ4296292.1 type IV pilus assembly protein PilM [Patescibacteria group bacterium]
MLGFFGAKEHVMLGIDIGTSTMKVVELTRSGGTTALTNYGQAKTREYLTTMKDVIGKDATATLEELVAKMLQTLLRELKPDATKAVMSIPAFSSFSTVMQFPAAMKGEELAAAVPYEASLHVPLPLSEVALDWISLPMPMTPEGPAAKREVLLVAVPQEIIEKYQRIAARAGIELAAVEVEMFSLARVTLAGMPHALLLDIGTSTTSIAVVADGFIRAVHSVEIAGGQLSKAIVNALRVNAGRAETVKQTEGITGTTPSGVRNVLTPFIDRIIVEVKRLLTLYESTAQRAIETVVLVGGSSRLPGIVQYLTDKLGRSVVLGTPLKQLQYPPTLEPIAPEINALYAVAIGLALRELSD